MENILNRIKVLMEYDTSKTLSENILITEQASLADDAAKALGILGKSLGDDVIRASRIVDDLGKPVSTMDDFIKLSKAGKVAPTQLGRVQSQLLKNTSLKIGQKSAMIDNYVSQAINKSRGVGKTSTQISDELVSKGFPKDVADDVGNKLSSHWKTNKSGPSAFNKTGTNTGKVKTTKSGKTKNLKPKKTKNPNTTKQTQQIADEAAKSTKTWPGWLKWGAGLGIGAGALWWFFHDSDDEVLAVPEDMPEEEPTDSGGAGTDGGGGGGSYKNCTDFPFIKYCKNPKIAEVQGCLGGLVVDGKLGPKTEAALENAGYGTDISEDDYNKIIQKCKGVQPSPEKEPGLDTTSDMSNKPE
jgi:hypothetical protein